MEAATDITRLTTEGGRLDPAALADFYQPPRDTDWLRANFVTSLDGAVEVGGVSGQLSSPADQYLLDVLRMQCDALLVGAGTLRQEGYGPIRLGEPARAWRRARGLPADPVLVVVSRSLDLDPARASFTQAPVRPIVFTCTDAPADRRTALAATADVVALGDHTTDLRQAVAYLNRRGLHQILTEGGPHVLGGLLAADLVDELCLTLSPLLAGPGAGRIVAGAPSPVRQMSLRHVLAAGDTLFLRYHRQARGLT